MDAQHFLFNLLYVLILFKRLPFFIVSILEESILNWGLLFLNFLISKLLLLFWLFFVLLTFTLLFSHLLLLFLLHSFRLSCPFLPFFYFFLFLFDFARVATPNHDITDQYKHFIVLNRFEHSFNSKLDIANFSLIEMVDIDIALLYYFLAVELWLFPFQYFLNAIWFGINDRTSSS